MNEKPRRNGFASANGDDRPSRTDRGQAYTLEGFVGAIIVLTAVLFALQSVVITPTTGGAVDRTVQAQLQQEVADALTVAENDGELSYLVRYWNNSTIEYHNSDIGSEQRGNYSHDRLANATAMSDTNGAFEFGFGTVLEERFKQSGRSYNVEVTYQLSPGAPDDATDSFYLVYQGRPSPNAFSASRTVTLYDQQHLTAAGSHETTLATADDAYDYPIPNVDDELELYNVVEIRVIVW